ncbi:MAG: hypothetical protein WCL70_12425 [Paludibacter sp.]
MNHFRQILQIFISVLLLNGCAVYYPQTTDIPLIKEKNELRVDGGISLFPAINGTVSYGLTEKIAVQLSGNLMVAGNHNPIPTFPYLITGAVGLYKFNPTNNWTKELYVGFGNGYSTDYYWRDMPYATLSGNYQIYYIQGNIGRRGIKHKFFEYAFGLKLGLINSHLHEHYDNPTFQPRNEVKHNELGAFIEPAISIKLGSDRLMFNIKPSFCYIKKIINTINTTNSYTTQNIFDFSYTVGSDYPYFPYGIGLSLNYRW